MDTYEIEANFTLKQNARHKGILILSVGIKMTKTVIFHIKHTKTEKKFNARVQV
jgi:hypothetical protein